ncbi:4Fe-4S binding protein [Polaromonas glacialis]|uniref:4Fe-4S binding protein n=1 Tax=Polaromonas glacialis TaxID=866564 RepID=UPI0009FBFED0|nr:4Fe-4S binding protein [Polaromonas glacialis]
MAPFLFRPAQLRAFATLTFGLLFFALCAWLPAQAGTMTRDAMLKAFPPPLIVGEKDRELPVWPILKQDGTATPIVAYVFESVDMAPIPGFSGTPFNLLVTLDAKGIFTNVRVLSHHEPVFLDGLGEEPMRRFVEQYKGVSLMQSIKIGAGGNSQAKAGSANVYLDGVAKATASVRILNQSLLAASLKVARAKMGYAKGRDPELVARIRPEVYAPMDWNALVGAGLVSSKTVSNRDIEQAFAGTVGAGQDREAGQAPEGAFVALHAAYLSVPATGRNLLTPEGWKVLQGRLDPGDHALLLVGKGRYSFLGDDFVSGSVPDRVTLQQEGLPLELRDLDLDARLILPAALQGAEWRVFRVNAPAGLDPAQALDFKLRVTRSKGMIYPERVNKDFAFGTALPAKYFESASADDKGWHSIWRARSAELAVLLAGLAVLAWALARPAWVSRSKRRLAIFRTGYLLFTLGFIGWYAQGQLSVVNITALVQALIAGRSLGFFMYDPMTVVLWGAVILSAVVWGRGTFCGWLCPFGALQELVSKAANALGVRQVRIPDRVDSRLKKLKYIVLGVIVLVACFSVGWTDRLVEVEPFKTSITLGFNRFWPFVAWAGGLVVLSAFFYKGYCRYLCPLGAGMVVLGRLRRFDWIARRAECGQPCQRCRSDCAYQAIDKPGKIDYDECFQCLDCVAIYTNEELCVPLILKNRHVSGQVRIPIAVAGNPAAKLVRGAP